MFKRKGGGVKGLLNNVKKNCTFLSCRLPLLEAIVVVHVTSSVIAAVYKKAGRRNWASLAS